MSRLSDMGERMVQYSDVGMNKKQTEMNCFYFTGKDGIIYGSVKRDIQNV